MVDASKYLGVTLTEDLSWDKHIQNTRGKANRTVGSLHRNLRDCTSPVKNLTYKTMVRPILEYSSTIWDPSSKPASRLWSKSNGERHAMFSTTKLQLPQDVSQKCSWTSTGNQWKFGENMTGSACYTEFSSIW